MLVGHTTFYGQQKKADSLSYLLETNLADSTRIDIYIKLSKELLEADTTLPKKYLNSAIELSQKTNDKIRLASSYLELAKYFDFKGDLPSARNILDQIEEQLPYFDDIRVKSAFHMESGIIYYFEATYDKAIKDILKALKGYASIGDSTTVGSCNMLMGICHEKLGNWDKALSYYLKTKSIYKSTGYEKGVAMVIGNLGTVYKAREEYSKALDCYFESLNFNQKRGYLKEARVDLNNIGNLYLHLQDYHNALQYLQKSLDLSKQLGSQTGILFSTYNLACVNYELGKYGLALEKNRVALKLAQKINSKDDIMNSYLLMSDIYEHLGKGILALDNRKNYEAWKDSVISENHLNQVKKLELEYETAEKDKQITLLAKEKEVEQKEAQRQATLKNTFVIGLVLISLLAGLFIYTLRQRIRNQKVLAVKNTEIKEANFKRQLTELEMKALQAQINPHFIFNCMNSINHMILSGENENASKYLTKFSKLIRLILENAEATEVPLKDELSLLESYIQLEALRFNGDIQYEMNVEENIDQENIQVPSMLIQPFVENAIWHGLAHKEQSKKGEIKIAVKEENDKLQFIIEDNGVGREKALELQKKSIWKKKSLGLKITEERLKLISKELQRQLIKITDLKDAMGTALGTRVEVNIPTA